jgi:hypothetical protein
MRRALAAGTGIVLAVFAVVLLGLVTSDRPLPDADLAWFAPVAQVAGVLGGAICHWRRPVPDPGSRERT